MLRILVDEIVLVSKQIQILSKIHPMTIKIKNPVAVNNI